MYITISLILKSKEFIKKNEMYNFLIKSLFYLTRKNSLYRVNLGYERS